MKTRLAFLLALLAVIAILHFTSAHADERTHFHIEAGDATQTLLEFSRQADIQIAYYYPTLHGTRTEAVDGDITWQDALSVMFQYQPYYYWDLVNDRMVMVFNVLRPVPVEPPADPSQWLRRFEQVTQVWAEGAGPVPAKLIVEKYATGERL